MRKRSDCFCCKTFFICTSIFSVLSFRASLRPYENRGLGKLKDVPEVYQAKAAQAAMAAEHRSSEVSPKVFESEAGETVLEKQTQPVEPEKPPAKEEKNPTAPLPVSQPTGSLEKDTNVVKPAVKPPEKGPAKDSIGVVESKTHQPPTVVSKKKPEQPKSSNAPQCVKDGNGQFRTDRPLKIFTFGPVEGLKPFLVDPTLEYCINTMFGSEVLIPRYLSTQYEHRVNSPAEADLVMMTMYPKCVHWRFREETDSNVEKAVVDMIYRWTIGNFTQKYGAVANRRQGRDHIYIFPSGIGARIFRSWEELCPNGIFLSPEGTNWRVLNKPKLKHYFNPIKDILIPGHYRFSWEVMQTSKPWEQRTITALYCGDFLKSPQRQAVGSLANIPAKPGSWIIRDFCPMHENTVTSKFCLVPQGWTPWTVRLYEAIFAGCIPVVFGDRYLFPFKNTVNYDSFVIRYPENDISRKLFDFLESFPNDKGKAMHQALLAERNKFFFNSTVPHHAFDSLLPLLEDKYCTWTLSQKTV